MSKEIKKENLLITKMNPAIRSETSVEGETILPDYCPAILRIIKTETATYVSSSAIRGDKLIVEGSVSFRVIYTSEEDNGLNSVLTAIPFSQSMDLGSESIQAFYVSSETTYSNTRALSPQKIYNKATVSLSACCLSETSADIVSADNDSTDFYMLKNEVPIFSVVSFGQKSIRVSDEIDLGEKTVAKIISSDISVRATESKRVNEKMIVKSEVIVNTLCISENNILFPVSHKSTVSQAIELHNTNDDTVYDIDCGVSEYKLSLAENQAGASHGIIFESEITVSAVCCNNLTATVCSDAFSGDFETESEFGTIHCGKFEAVSKEFTVRENTEIGYYTQIYDMKTDFMTKETEYDIQNGVITVRGSAFCSFLYTDHSGEISFCDRELPFLLELGSTPNGDAVVSDIRISVIGKAFAASDGKTVEIRIDAVCTAGTYIMNSVPCLTSAVRTDRKPDISKHGLTVYYPSENDTVFSVAKKYRKNPNDIITANSLTDSIGERHTLFV